MTRRRRFARILALLTVALLTLAVSSCEKSRRPNILWIVWDTVRADHLGLYGYERNTTPNLDRWAGNARVFENCLSTAGYTLPSHASMFTGLLPSEHCTDNHHGQLDDAYTTIAEALRSVGYRSYLYSANPHISNVGNFDQGFDRTEHPWSPSHRELAVRIVRDKLADEKRGSEMRRSFERADRGEGFLTAWSIKAAGELAEKAVLSWLGSDEADRPFFVFVNYMEAHRPLVPPRAHRERMMSPEQVDRSYDVDRSWLPTWEYTFGLRELDDDEIALTRATYDAALAELDDLFGELMQSLEEGGWLENTVVVLTSDHGEHLGEQHMLDHQYSVYQPLLRVPLIVHYPARFAAGRDARPVVNFDLFPTLLELSGVAPPIGLRSRAVSLLDPEEVRPRFAEDPAASRAPVTTIKQNHPDWDSTPWQRRLRTLVADGHKLIWGSDGRHELFDLETDPLEMRDLTGERPELADRMRESLDAYHGSLQLCVPRGGPPPELTPEHIERLKALGYLGG
jgi:arylsulfatase A-like enzyme